MSQGGRWQGLKRMLHFGFRALAALFMAVVVAVVAYWGWEAHASRQIEARASVTTTWVVKDLPLKSPGPVRATLKTRCERFTLLYQVTLTPGTGSATVQDDPGAKQRLGKASAAALQAMKDYQASLQRLLTVYESDLGRAKELLDERRQLLTKGGIDRREVQEAEILRTTAQHNVDETRQWIAEAERLQLEASLLGRPGSSPGGREASGRGRTLSLAQQQEAAVEQLRQAVSEFTVVFLDGDGFHLLDFKLPQDGLTGTVGSDGRAQFLSADGRVVCDRAAYVRAVNASILWRGR